jgi:hypothetical protein
MVCGMVPGRGLRGQVINQRREYDGEQTHIKHTGEQCTTESTGDDARRHAADYRPVDRIVLVMCPDTGNRGE